MSAAEGLESQMTGGKREGGDISCTLREAGVRACQQSLPGAQQWVRSMAHGFLPVLDVFLQRRMVVGEAACGQSHGTGRMQS